MITESFAKIQRTFSKLDIAYFIKGGLWLFLTDMIVRSLGILQSVAFARWVDKDFYGQYKLFFSVLGLLAIFSLPGLNLAVMQSVARGYDSSLFRGIKTKLKWSLLGSVILVNISLYFKYIKPNNLWLCFLLAAIFFPLLRSLETINSFFIAKGWFDKSSFYRSAVQLASCSAVLGSLYFFRDLHLVILASFSTVTVVNLSFYYRLSRDNLNMKEIDPGLLNYSKHLSFTRGIAAVAFHLDKLLIAYFLDFEQVAIYSIASVIPSNIKPLMIMVEPLTLPKLSNVSVEQVYGKVRPKLPLLFVLGFLVVAIGIPILPCIIRFLYSSKYSGSTVYAQILLFSLIFGFPSAIFSSVLISQKSRKELYIYSVLYSLPQIVLFFILTPTYGVMGVVLTRLIARFGGFIYQWYAVKRLQKIPS